MCTYNPRLLTLKLTLHLHQTRTQGYYFETLARPLSEHEPQISQERLSPAHES